MFDEQCRVPQSSFHPLVWKKYCISNWTLRSPLWLLSSFLFRRPTPSSFGSLRLVTKPVTRITPRPADVALSWTSCSEVSAWVGTRPFWVMRPRGCGISCFRFCNTRSSDSIPEYEQVELRTGRVFRFLLGESAWTCTCWSRKIPSEFLDGVVVSVCTFRTAYVFKYVEHCFPSVVQKQDAFFVLIANVRCHEKVLESLDPFTPPSDRTVWTAV